MDRREKSITRATIIKAYDRIQEAPEEITGPKRLNAFGAPYIWAIFLQLKIAAAPVRSTRAGAGRKKNAAANEEENGGFYDNSKTGD